MRDNTNYEQYLCIHQEIVLGFIGVCRSRWEPAELVRFCRGGVERVVHDDEMQTSHKDTIAKRCAWESRQIARSPPLALRRETDSLPGGLLAVEAEAGWRLSRMQIGDAHELDGRALGRQF